MARIKPTPRLISSKKGIPPEQAGVGHIRQYINNVLWHLNYLEKAFASDGQEEIAGYFRESLRLATEAKQRWTKPL